MLMQLKSKYVNTLVWGPILTINYLLTMHIISILAVY